MKRQLILRNLLLGLSSWIIPFAVSFLFYKPGGELVVPYATFKTLIMLIGVVSGCYLLTRYFKFVEDDFISNGLIVGLSWFAINLILDIIVLVPMMNTTISAYFMSIGLSYLAIPTISFTIGCLLQHKLKRR